MIRGISNKQINVKLFMLTCTEKIYFTITIDFKLHLNVIDY